MKAILILIATFSIVSCVSTGTNLPDIGKLESTPDCKATDHGCLEPVYGKEVIYVEEGTRVQMSKETFLKIRRNIQRMHRRIQTYEDIMEKARKK